MGGNNKIDRSENQLQSIADAQRSAGARLGDQGQSLINTGQEQQAPLVSFLQSIIGGNSTTTNQALQPVLSNITRQTAQNREHVYDQIGPGAARDVVLGENLRSQGAQTAQATNDVFLKAFPELASLSGQNTNAGLGLTGAGITSTGNSASTTGTVLNEQQRRKQSQLEAFSGLAGAAGNIATGGGFGALAGLLKSKKSPSSGPLPGSVDFSLGGGN